MKVRSAAFLWLCCAACDRASAAGAIRHPTAENLPAVDHTIDKVAANGGGGLEALARALARVDTVLSIGELEGDQTQVFGFVEDVQAGHEGEILVLDSRFNQVRVYGPDGHFRSQFGGPGRGPEEFLAPEGMHAGSSGSVAVIDRNSLVKLLEWRDGVLAYAGGFRVPLVPEDMCRLGDDVVLQGVTPEGKTLHQYDREGKLARSFGAAYRSSNPLVVNQLSDAIVGCDAAVPLVALMFEHLPIVYGYRTNGEIAWTSRLGGFNPIQIVEEVDAESGRPAIVTGGGDADFDMAHALISLAPRIFLLQTTHHTHASQAAREPYASVDTYLLDAATGAGVYVGTHLPPIADAANGLLYSASADPHPQVLVLRAPALHAALVR